jgi:hypothetical protein
MKRREFLTSSLVVAGAAGLSSTFNAGAAEGEGNPAREYYELRVYHLRRGAKQQVFDDYLRQAAVPAMNRAGVGPIGVFSVMVGPDSPAVYTLIPYKSIEAFASLGARLHDDAEYQQAGAPVINAPASEPVFVRLESSLMVAFEGMPKLEVPSATAEKKPRLFELRTYESHSKKAHAKKVEMFNRGEIAIFRRTGLQPVFFGDTLVGPKLPNLIYMLVFDSLAARDKNWSSFGGDPEWRKLSSTPGYTDPEIVSNISNVLLRPTSYSQI